MPEPSIGFIDTLKNNASAPARPLTSKRILALTAFAALGIASAWLYAFVGSSVKRGNAAAASAATPVPIAPLPATPAPVAVDSSSRSRVPSAAAPSLVARIRRGDLNETPN